MTLIELKRNSLGVGGLMLNFNIMLVSMPIQLKVLMQINNSSYMATMSMRCLNRHVSFSTQPLHPVALPRPMETHLWYVIPDEVKNSSLIDQYLEILSPVEKQSVLSLQGDERRKRALFARALVRTTLARYQTNSYGDPRSLKFKKNPYGKPEVDWECTTDSSPRLLHFNLSHTTSLIACGITTHSSVIGVDVEEKKRMIKNNVMSFARRFFSQQEVEHLANILDPELQRQEFIKLWTLKESYVKALGRGFSAAPFKTFSIHIRAPLISVSDFSDMASSKVSEYVPDSKWKFALLELADTHYASICIEKDASFEEHGDTPMKLRVWKTVPFLEDLCMSGTHSVVPVAGRVHQLKS